jgi:hypothetical protein
MDNLNDLLIPTDDCRGESLKDYSICTAEGHVQVYFRNLEAHLVRHIADADIAVGDVAWLTNSRILNSLSEKKGVSIIVQKEDFCVLT